MSETNVKREQASHWSRPAGCSTAGKQPTTGTDSDTSIHNFWATAWEWKQLLDNNNEDHDEKEDIEANEKQKQIN